VTQRLSFCTNRAGQPRPQGDEATMKRETA
jgi:hypothetical protein